MANTIGTLDVSVGGCFAGIGELVVFDSLSDASYASAKLSSFTGAVKVRPLYNGSTSWTGDDPDITQLKDEDGNVQCSYAEGGSNSFETVCMKLNQALTKKFLGGAAISDASLSDDTWIKSSDIIGVAGNYHTSIMPVAKFDKSKGVAIVFPKALCTASLVSQDDGVGIKLTFEALDINTSDLKQLMIVSAATANYTP